MLVEDDAMIAQGLQTALRQAGFAVDWMRDGGSAAAALQTAAFDVVLLDLGLPQRDGIDVLRELRKRGDKTPVIILTARDEIQHRIAGLDAGADDYVVKPFDLDEVPPGAVTPPSNTATCVWIWRRAPSSATARR
jgi:two-component system response regulator QseB